MRWHWERLVLVLALFWLLLCAVCSHYEKPPAPAERIRYTQPARRVPAFDDEDDQRDVVVWDDKNSGVLLRR